MSDKPNGLHPCTCGKGYLMWNQSGREFCGHTLELYKQRHGPLPESFGVLSFEKPKGVAA